PGLAGPDRLFDPATWRIVGIDVSADPHATVRDVVRDQRRALIERGIERLDVVIGGSLGGMQALQWAVDFPHAVGHAIAIAAHDHQTAMGIAYNAVQREAIAIEPARGLRLARKLAMLTYKSDALLAARHDRRPDRNGLRIDARVCFDVEGYLEHQADVFERRFDPARYVALTHIMDSFDLRCHPERSAASCHPERSAPSCHPERSTPSCHPERSAEGAKSKDHYPRLTFVGISSDLLFRPHDVRAASERFRTLGYDAAYVEMRTDHGHDAFLAESENVARLLSDRLAPTLATTTP
ncbi:MAG: alpha/beta fold hydrolase, partial [Candidatus Eremiobacteraeota bacterium]|nr:alpha/beta fold hydrolase [Candidatus Eremiobacteraeota bacterium]